jgi:signal transduction histidine kinase
VAAHETERLRTLLETGLAISSELSLDAVLQRIVEAAARGDQRLAEQFADRAAIAVDLSRRVARDPLRRIIEGQELERRRLARELHDETGQALTSVLLGLKVVEDAKDEEQVRRGGSVTAVVEDDGHGFSPEATVASEGIGLSGMRERVALVEGRLQIESSPGAGTTLVAEVPVA